MYVHFTLIKKKIWNTHGQLYTNKSFELDKQGLGRILATGLDLLIICWTGTHSSKYREEGFIMRHKFKWLFFNTIFLACAQNESVLSTSWWTKALQLCVRIYTCTHLPSSISQHGVVVQSCLTLCDLMACSTPGFPVLYRLPEFAQTHDSSWSTERSISFVGALTTAVFS